MDTLGSRKTFKKGQTLMKQGEEGHEAYIIENGRVEILIVTKDGEEQAVATRGAGAMIGEMALIDSAPRTATIRAIEDCDVLEITRDDFTRRLESADPVLKMATRVILVRYRDTLARAKISRESSQWPPPETVELDFSKSNEAIEGIKISSDFKSALDDKKLELHYQPIVDIPTGHVKGFEALMRWPHPEKGYISPGIFIPIIEDNGLIVEASKWALQEACEALKRIEQKTLKKNMFMSVNFSSRDFAADDFAKSVYDTIIHSGLAPKQLHIEITERLLMDQPDNARDVLKLCKKEGISIAIDDFGTGYSSLSYLRHFPIDTLKIDRSFIQNLHKNASSLSLVKSIIALAQNMNMKTIAEGIELKEEATVLKDLGCEMAQGYFFAKPMPESDIINFLNN